MLETILLTDTNIITDLDAAGILNIYVNLDNTYMSDMVKRDEVNKKTCNLNLINKMKVIKSSENQIYEMSTLTLLEKNISSYDIINFILARDGNYVLATGDKSLKKYCAKYNVKVIGTIGIIDLLYDNKIIDVGKYYDSLVKLKNDSKTRLPKEEINIRINRLIDLK